LGAWRLRAVAIIRIRARAATSTGGWFVVAIVCPAAARGLVILIRVVVIVGIATRIRGGGIVSATGTAA
jgi:hypothetical protein